MQLDRNKAGRNALTYRNIMSTQCPLYKPKLTMHEEKGNISNPIDVSKNIRFIFMKVCECHTAFMSDVCMLRTTSGVSFWSVLQYFTVDNAVSKRPV